MGPARRSRQPRTPHRFGGSGERPSVSPTTRYGFAILVSLYGIYQIANDHPLAGLIGIGLAVALLWLGRGR